MFLADVRCCLTSVVLCLTLDSLLYLGIMLRYIQSKTVIEMRVIIMLRIITVWLYQQYKSKLHYCWDPQIGMQRPALLLAFCHIHNLVVRTLVAAS
jgi:hypothetical protein